MIFSIDVLVKVLIVFLGMCGFWIAKHIRNHKVNNAPLVCPIGFDCHAVVHSDYSKILGMTVEFLGMIYYALISLLYFSFIFMPSMMVSDLISFLITTSFFAFVFSIYLLVVQIFILKKGCSWCIVSSIVSALIFILASGIYKVFLL